MWKTWTIRNTIVAGRRTPVKMLRKRKKYVYESRRCQVKLSKSMAEKWKDFVSSTSASLSPVGAITSTQHFCMPSRWLFRLLMYRRPPSGFHFFYADIFFSSLCFFSLVAAHKTVTAHFANFVSASWWSNEFFLIFHLCPLCVPRIKSALWFNSSSGWGLVRLGF